MAQALAVVGDKKPEFLLGFAPWSARGYFFDTKDHFFKTSTLSATSTNMPERILIVAFSGRALAAAARRAGYVPLVADLFADVDTEELAGAHRLVKGELEAGFCADHLLESLEYLAATKPQPLGLIYGAGFEACPDLLREMAKRWRLIGNAPEMVARMKEPSDFAGTCARLSISHPAVANAVPSSGRWLRKSAGGAGGAHILPASATDPDDKNTYFQEEVSGTAISVLFLAAGGDAVVIGFSEQWRAPCPDAPFRFGGAVRPAAISTECASALSQEVHLLAREYGLVGLNSADFLVSENGRWILEINPRPGATLDIFDSDDHPLLAMHIAAILNGTLPDAPKLDGAAATQIVYASHALSVPQGLHYPSWTMDRPRSSITLAEGEPFCTVLAKGETACEAKQNCASYERHWRAVLKG